MRFLDKSPLPPSSPLEITRHLGNYDPYCQSVHEIHHAVGIGKMWCLRSHHRAVAHKLQSVHCATAYSEQCASLFKGTVV